MSAALTHHPHRRDAAMHQLAERIGAVASLDAPARELGRSVRSVLGNGRAKALLSGEPLGHALHPTLTDIPIGTWTAATMLDLAGGRQARPAARRLIAIGLLASAPTAASGLSDWSEHETADASVRRIGIVHAAANVVSLGLYGASLRARRRGRHRRGVALGLAGAGTLAASGYLGGHLAFARAVGVERTPRAPSGASG